MKIVFWRGFFAVMVSMFSLMRRILFGVRE